MPSKPVEELVEGDIIYFGEIRFVVESVSTARDNTPRTEWLQDVVVSARRLHSRNLLTAYFDEGTTIRFAKIED